MRGGRSGGVLVVQYDRGIVVQQEAAEIDAQIRVGLREVRAGGRASNQVRQIVEPVSCVLPLRSGSGEQPLQREALPHPERALCGQHGRVCLRVVQKVRRGFQQRCLFLAA